MILHLIRHGKTPGNEQKRYIGVTDEALSEVGRSELTERSYPLGELIVVSPMLRCLQTAEAIYGDDGRLPRKVVPDLRECDFGRFEGKNYMELNGDEDYQRWIDSGGTLPFPEGETVTGFKARTVQAFEELLPELAPYREVVFVVHGGTIMALLEHYEASHSYYDWQCKNGCGYTVCWENNEMKRIGTIE